MNSTVVATSRSANGVRILVKTPRGVKLILANKLVISIPPKLCNLKGIDLSTTERDLFGQFLNGAYYTGLLRNTGIPDNIVVTNVGADTLYNLPPGTFPALTKPSADETQELTQSFQTVPALYGVGPTRVPGLKDVKFGASSALTNDAAVKSAIISQIQKLKSAGTITTATTPEFVAYNSHTPYELRVSADAIKAGFYKNLTALQGHRNTWWTGAAFSKQASGNLWAFTAGLLPDIAAAA